MKHSAFFRTAKLTLVAGCTLSLLSPVVQSCNSTRNTSASGSRSQRANMMDTTNMSGSDTSHRDILVHPKPSVQQSTPAQDTSRDILVHPKPSKQ